MIETKREDLITDLVSYGLTPVQAQAYLTLLMLGSTTAKSISRASEINRVDIYRALRHLKKLGVVEEKLGNPAEFVAVEPDQTIDILISSKLRVIDHLRSGKSELHGKLVTYRNQFATRLSADSEVDETGRDMYLKVIWGEQMFRRVQSVVLQSKREIVTIFAPSVMIIYDRMGIPKLQEEKQRNTNIKIRALTNIVPENLEEAYRYSKVVELRHNELPDTQLRYTIVDDEKLILPVGDPPYDITEGTALWTNSKILISSLKSDFETLWVHSIPAKERIQILHATQK